MTIDALDLEDFLAHKGWQWLKARYEQEWGAQVIVDKITAIAKTAPDAAAQQHQVNQVLVAQREVSLFMAAPEREMSKLREAAQKQGSTESRRGPGL